MYAVYDEFELVFQHYCYNDELTLSSQKADFTQIIYPTDQGGGSLFGKTNVPATSVTQTDTTCALTHALEIYDGSTKTWIDYDSLSAGDKSTLYPQISNYDSATAVFDILFVTDLGSTFDGKAITMRIKTTDVLSASPPVLDTFVVSFVYQCASDSMSITSIAGDIPGQHYKFSDPASSLQTPSISHTSGCEVTYRLMAYSNVI